MQPKSATQKKDPTPILFTSPPISPLKSPIKSSFISEFQAEKPTGNGVCVYLELIEVNQLKVKTKKDFIQQRTLSNILVILQAGLILQRVS